MGYYYFKEVSKKMAKEITAINYYLIDVYGQAVAKYKFVIADVPEEVIDNLYFVAWRDLENGEIEAYGSFYDTIAGTKEYRIWTNDKFQDYVNLYTRSTQDEITRLQKKLAEGF